MSIIPTLNERVLHKLGSRGSVLVAVPQDWLRYYGLAAGDRVQVIANGELIIRPLKRLGNSAGKTGNQTTGENRVQA